MESFNQRREAPLVVVSLAELREKVRAERHWSRSFPSTSAGELIASYNWLEPAEEARQRQIETNVPSVPTIVIPGAPQIFNRWRDGVLNPNTELPFADENRFFLDTYPMEPVFRAALFEGHDPLAFQTLDLVTDRYNLRLLFEFCKFRNGYTGQAPMLDARPPHSFEIDVERFGRQLVVFEQKSSSKYPPRLTPIYGTDFESNCTRPSDDLTRGSFYSITKYELDSELSCLVRFNPDCAEEWREKVERNGDLPEVDLEEFPDSRIKYIRHGYRKYDFNFVELTTKRQDTSYPEYLWEQMFLGRVGHAYIGWHKDGHCMWPQSLSLADLEHKFSWNRMQVLQSAFRAECFLLKKIIAFIRNRPDGERYTLVYDSQNTPDLIRLYRRLDTVASSPHAGLLPLSLRRTLEGRI